MALWNADQKYYYAKRFSLADDANFKPQSMLGDNKDSRIVLLSDREEATFRVLFADETREPMDVVMADFIDAKSPKAKGKRLTTLEVAKIEDITPEPVEEPADETPAGDEPAEEKPESTTTEIEGVPFTITNEQQTETQSAHKEPSEDDQLSLF